jgi:hypothetical protein
MSKQSTTVMISNKLDILYIVMISNKLDILYIIIWYSSMRKRRDRVRDELAMIYDYNQVRSKVGTFLTTTVWSLNSIYLTFVVVFILMGIK